MHSIWSDQVQETLKKAKEQALMHSSKKVQVAGKEVEIPQPFPSPGDWRDGCIYFLMVDRFCNPQKAPKHQPWDGKHGTFQDGNLRGVQAQLPYLEELGAKAIWLSPIFKNCSYNDFSYHGYGIQDFINIDPRFGSDEDLRNLVDEAHARGMHVILDIVLNHTGDVFAYPVYHSEAAWVSEVPWKPSPPPYPIKWRNEHGNPDKEDPSQITSHDGTIWPIELRENRFFRRRGKLIEKKGKLTEQEEQQGDFYSLKDMVTELKDFSSEHGHYFPVRDILIRAYQYWIARMDIDGYRIDTLKHVEPEFARIFGNAMREFAASIGKKNFFTFGEVADDDEKIAKFIGRAAFEPSQLMGVDSALDFPLFYKLPNMLKGWMPPSQVVGMFQHRRDVQRGILSSQGEAGRFLITFLDNHDQHHRFYYQDPEDSHKYDAQATLGIGSLFCLQGIPCLYYGTEQGLHGMGKDSDQYVREALWGKDNAFDRNHPFYQTIKTLSRLQMEQPALRYGRQYFRPISGNGQDFGISAYAPGVLAFSRILSDTEIMVILNTHTSESWQGEMIADFALNPVDAEYHTLFSNMGTGTSAKIRERSGNGITIHEPDGRTSYGPVRTLPVSLKPMEIQIMGQISYRPA